MTNLRRLLAAATVVAVLVHLCMRSREVDTATERRQFRLSWHRIHEKLDLDVAEDNSGDHQTVRQDRQCTMKTQIAFAKTHKTGSSTLQNVFFRFGIEHNLTFALHPNSWMFSLKDKFNASVVLDGPWKSLAPFDLFVFHSVWNHQEVKRLLPRATFLTLLRDPVDCFESNYVYMGLGMDINKFATKEITSGLEGSKTNINGRNPMSMDLGLDPGDMDNVEKVQDFIRELDTQFDLVMILEHFDESLILLQDLMCWSTEELVYLKQNERISESKTNMTDETRQTLKRWLWADYMLYDHFRAKLERAINSFDESEMASRLKSLQVRNDHLRSDCTRAHSHKGLKGEFRNYFSPLIKGYVVDTSKSWCALFARSEPIFYRQLQAHQTLMVKMNYLRQGKLLVPPVGQSDLSVDEERIYCVPF